MHKVITLGLFLALACARAGLADAGLVAFYVPWDAQGRTSLAAHVADIYVFAPFWITLITRDGVPSITDDSTSTAILQGAPHSPHVMPVVANAHNGIWDQETVDAIFGSRQAETTLASSLVKLAAEKQYSGYIFDFENLSPNSIAALPVFVKAVGGVFVPAHLETWITVPLESADWPARAIQDAGATAVLMAYDECWANSTPGPIAGDDWFTAGLATRMRDLDASKTVIVLGNYAYDWPKGKPAAALSVQQAIQLAHDNSANITQTAPQSNPVFVYTGADTVPHVVWMLDSSAYSRQRATALRFGPRAVGLWRLGLEDDAVWSKAGGTTQAKSTSTQVPAPVCSMLPIN